MLQRRALVSFLQLLLFMWKWLSWAGAGAVVTSWCWDLSVLALDQLPYNFYSRQIWEDEKLYSYQHNLVFWAKKVSQQLCCCYRGVSLQLILSGQGYEGVLRYWISDQNQSGVWWSNNLQSKRPSFTGVDIGHVSPNLLLHATCLQSCALHQC